MGRLAAVVVTGVLCAGTVWAATLDIEALERLKKRSEISAFEAHAVRREPKVGARALELIERLIRQPRPPAAEQPVCVLDEAPAQPRKDAIRFLLDHSSLRRGVRDADVVTIALVTRIDQDLVR